MAQSANASRQPGASPMRSGRRRRWRSEYAVCFSLSTPSSRHTHRARPPCCKYANTCPRRMYTCLLNPDLLICPLRDIMAPFSEDTTRDSIWCSLRTRSTAPILRIAARSVVIGNYTLPNALCYFVFVLPSLSRQRCAAAGGERGPGRQAEAESALPPLVACASRPKRDESPRWPPRRT